MRSRGGSRASACARSRGWEQTARAIAACQLSRTREPTHPGTEVGRLNALHHTPAATPVHVRTFVSDGEAVLEVADEGPGIPPEDAERVFERFFRADPARARGPGSTGLGLSIVAAVAEAHGGRACYRPRTGGGSVFEVRLPLVSRVPVSEPDA